MEFLTGLFQAFAVRSGGFYVVNIATLRVALQVLYATMMYISAYPVAITIRNSNVYEERSMGIYADDPGYEATEYSKKGSPAAWLKRQFRPHESGRLDFVQHQLRAQLAHDLWWLVLAVFLIMIVEGSQFEKDPEVFSVFNVIFEVVSGKFGGILRTGYLCLPIKVTEPSGSQSAFHGQRIRSAAPGTHSASSFSAQS
jgi:Trk-type K+ transport system membrane component